MNGLPITRRDAWRGFSLEAFAKWIPLNRFSELFPGTKDEPRAYP
jgi:hypothetical protein